MRGFRSLRWRLTAPEPPPAATPDPPAFTRREQLRDERNRLVAELCRLTGERHRLIHARMNRITGAKSVAAATVDQLEQANARLRRELSELS